MGGGAGHGRSGVMEIGDGKFFTGRIDKGAGKCLPAPQTSEKNEGMTPGESFGDSISPERRWGKIKGASGKSKGIILGSSR